MKYKKKDLDMPSLDIQAAQVENDGSETTLDNLRNSRVAKEAARLAVEAAHREVMEGKPQEDAEIAAEKNK